MKTRYLSIKEVAAVLHIDVKTVYKMVKNGDIPGHFKLGSLHFVDEEVFTSSLKRLATQDKRNVAIVTGKAADRHNLAS